MIRENRYCVLKYKDLEQCLSIEQIKQLDEIMITAYDYRKSVNKPKLQCVVVESDWPEYEIVWGMIANRVNPQTKKFIVTICDPHSVKECSDWAQSNCTSFVSVETIDISDISGKYDIMATFTFTDNEDMLNFKTAFENENAYVI